MNIWLITQGEPLKDKKVRPYKTGVLSEMLVSNGHRVTWWTSTFDHQSKSYIFNNDQSVLIGDRLEMVYLHSFVSYNKNISIRRIINHRIVANKFYCISESKATPDLIYCSFPTIELAYAAVQYARRKSIPVVVDTRDLWPDIFIHPFPKIFHRFLKVILTDYFRKTEYIFKNVDGITAVSEKYLNWSLKYGKRKISLYDGVFPLAYNKKDQDFENDFDVELTEKGVSPDKLTVWFVGTFGHTYDLSTVIHGARILEKEKIENIQFVITGDGENMKRLVNQAKGLQNVVFTGWVDQHVLKQLSDIADIGLMAYSKGAPQGFPNKMFEYMSFGIPILSSLQGESEEFIGLNKIGLSYEPESISSFVKNLKYLIEDKLLMRELGKNGKRLLENEYTSDIVYNKLLDYLDRIINDRK